MRNIRLELCYDGSGFHGWQRQENADTVQERVEAAAETIYGKHLTVYGCSRTDAGVHAKQFFCNFRADTDMDTDTVVRAFNGNLPDSVAVLAARDVPESFHSRYSCVSKEYIYRILNRRERDPFLKGRCLHYVQALDAGLMDEAAGLFEGGHDFAAFCSSGSSVESTVRNVYEAAVEKSGDEIVFRVRADGFLYNMVRIMTGTLIGVGSGKTPLRDIPDIIGSLDRQQAGFTAPAEGLYLNRVFYGSE